MALHLTPSQHVPLPAKIRTEILVPIYLDTAPARLEDQEYVDGVYDEIQAKIQARMDEMAKRRRFPIFA